MNITKHSYNGAFDNFFENYQPKQENKTTESSLVKVASGCISCPYFGNVSSDKCNNCIYASGVSYANGDTYIKCSYGTEGLKKEASSVQALHWENTGMPTLEHYNKVREDIKTKFEEELKYAARNIGVKLAQSNLDEFIVSASKENLAGRSLEKAAKSYVAHLNEKIAPAEKRAHTGKLDNVFTMVTKSSKTVVPNISSYDKADSNNCGYLGSKSNPNTIWNSEALTKAAQTPGSDEITAGYKKEIENEKKAFKDSYFKALEKQLSEKGIVSNAKVHSLSVEASSGFNSNLPQNAMGIFGDNKEFTNIPEKTSGEMLSEENTKRANKKAESNKEIKIEKTSSVESKNWLFKV